MSDLTPTIDQAYAAQIQGDDDPRLGTASLVTITRQPNGSGLFDITFSFPEGEPFVVEHVPVHETYLLGVTLSKYGYLAEEVSSTVFTFTFPATDEAAA